MAAFPLYHVSVAHADHRGGDDILGVVHLHRLPVDLGADARRAGQCDAVDGTAFLSARHHRWPAWRGSRDFDGDDPIPPCRHPDFLVRPATQEVATRREQWLPPVPTMHPARGRFFRRTHTLP